MNCNFSKLIKDNNVRQILQRIHDELRSNNSRILVKIPSFTGKVELFNQNALVENDEYFIRCLKDRGIINHWEFKVRHPDKKIEFIDQALLNTPEEFKTPYVTVSFDVRNKQFLNNLYMAAIDALVVNPYPSENQEDIVIAAIAAIKSLTSSEKIVFSWDEIDKEDRKHIKIGQTLKNLQSSKEIEILYFEGKLNNQNKYNGIQFQATISYAPKPFSGKNVLKCNSLSLIIEPDSQKAFYPKIKNQNRNTSFRASTKYGENRYFTLLKRFLEKKGSKILNYSEIYPIVCPNRNTRTKFDRLDKRAIESAINYLKHKLNNPNLFVYHKDSYELKP